MAATMPYQDARKKFGRKASAHKRKVKCSFCQRHFISIDEAQRHERDYHARRLAKPREEAN